MHGSQDGVVTARWELGGQIGAIADVRRDVAAFAGRYGMAAGGRADVGAAVSVAVAVAAGPRAERAEGGAVVVDAATDGEWLSVRVRGEARCDHDADPSVALPLMVALAARVEWDPGRGEQGPRSLMEFPIEGDDGHRGGLDACARRTRRGGMRRGAAPRRTRPGG